VWLGQYLYYDSPDNGDMHVLVPGRFLAFRGPRDDHGDWLDAFSYIDAFQSLSVHTVVRLNTPDYDKAVFTSAGFEHLDLLFPDCTVPPFHIVDAFLRAAESLRPGQMMAVHCLAGLGRTGTLIGLYMMKHHGFSANEAIGWLRICRPGSVIGPQQQFLADEEKRMHRLGAEQTPGLGDNFDTLSPVSSCVPPHSFKHTSKMLADMVTDGMMNRSQRRGANDSQFDATVRHNLLPWLKHRASKPQTSSPECTNTLKRSNSETFTTQHTTTAGQDHAKSKGGTSSPNRPHNAMRHLFHPQHSKSQRLPVFKHLRLPQGGIQGKGPAGLSDRHSGIESLRRTGSFNNTTPSLTSLNRSPSLSRCSSIASNSSIAPSGDDHSTGLADSESPLRTNVFRAACREPVPVGSMNFGGLEKLHSNVPTALLRQIMLEELASAGEQEQT
jgi:protein-tyrosine phosphatase